MRKFFKKRSNQILSVLLLLPLLVQSFVIPIFALDELIPETQVDIPIDTSEDILDEGISDPKEIAEPTLDKDIPVPKETVKPTWVTSKESATTSSSVVLGEKYVYPNNSDVTVTFSKLPTSSGTLTIKTVYLTDEQVKITNAASNVAYDITTDMVDGTFNYDLTLPKVGDSTKVVYAESVSDLVDAKDISNVIENGSSLKIEGLDHFTTFVVVSTIPTGITEGITDVNDSCTAELVGSNTKCYDTIQEAIIAATDGTTINVKAGTYEITSTIVVNKQVNIVGPSTGIAKIVNTSTPSASVFRITASNVSISGFELTVLGSFATAGTEVANAIIAIPGGFSLSDISINNNNIHASYPSGTLQKNMYARGITVDNNSVTSLSITNNTISNVRNGVVVRNVNTADVSNNTIYNTKGGIMHYTSSFADAANRIMTGNNWTDIHNEWDIVWNSATYGFPNYQESLLEVSSANNNAYIVDIRRDSTTEPANLINNRSHVFVTSSGIDKVHQTTGNMNEPFATLQYAQNIVTPGGVIILQSDLHTSAQININKPLTMKGNDHIIYSEFTKSDNSNNSALGIFSDNVSLLDISVDGTNGTNLHGINIYSVKNILFDNIRISNNDNAGMVVNGSKVTVNNISTTDNGWGGINVDQGSGVTTEAKLTVSGTSRHTELKAIWMDDYRRLVSLNDENLQYDYVDNGYERIYFLSMDAPTVLGWNVKNSPSDSPSLPRPNTELSCNEYTNINGASSHWTDVSGENSLIKYERQFRYNLGSGWTNWAGSEVYSNPYTNFRTFGSGIGNDGVYDTQVRAFVDLNGNNAIDTSEPRSGWSNGCQITFDKTAPSGTLDGLYYVKGANTYTLNNWSTNTTTPVFKGSYADANGVSNVSLSIASFTDNAQLDNGTWMSPTLGPITTDGTHTLTVTITDNAGNPTVLTQDITIDTVAPTATHTYFKDGSPIGTSPVVVNNVGQLSFTGNYEDLTSGLYWDTFVIFQAQDDGTFAFEQGGKQSYCGWRGTSNTINLSGNTYSFTNPVNFDDCVSTLPDGTYYISHQVFDNATRKDIPEINQYRDVVGLKFTVDATHPAIPTLVSPSNNTFTRGEVLINSWSDISTDIDYYIYESYHDSELTDLRWRQNVHGTSKTATNVSDATFWWRVKAVDFAGNESDWSDPWKVTIDNINPTKPENLYFKDDNNQNIQCGGYSNTKHISEYWDASEDANLDYYEYSSYNAPNGSVGLVSKILYTNFYDTNWWEIPSEGTYGFQVRAVDKAGNKSEWALINATGIDNSCQINIDWTYPDITLGAYSPDWTNQDIVVTASTNEGTLNASSHTFTQNGTFDFVATDDAGNITTQTVTITNIDKTSPTINSMVILNGLLTVTSTDTPSDVKSVEVQINGGTWTPYTPGMNLYALVSNVPGTYPVSVRVTDNANNPTTESTSFTIVQPATTPGGQTLGARTQRTALATTSTLTEETTETTTEEEITEEEILGETTCEATYKISGTVYYDNNDNGIKDDNEKVVEGIKVNIYNSNKELEKTVTTDEKGYWEASLCPGEYTTQVERAEDQTFVLGDSDTTLDISVEKKTNWWLIAVIGSAVVILLVVLADRYNKRKVS